MMEVGPSDVTLLVKFPLHLCIPILNCCSLLDIVPEQATIAETVVESESHEAEDLQPHVFGMAQEQDDDASLIEESLEEPEAIELEHTTKSQLSSISDLEAHPDLDPAQ